MLLDDRQVKVNDERIILCERELSHDLPVDRKRLRIALVACARDALINCGLFRARSQQHAAVGSYRAARRVGEVLPVPVVRLDP
jgi:hypothetical protein